MISSAWIGCSSSFFAFSSSHPPPPGLFFLSLHDALPICPPCNERLPEVRPGPATAARGGDDPLAVLTPVEPFDLPRSEEHTSELQSHSDLVCRLLLEKKRDRRASGRTARPPRGWR